MHSNQWLFMESTGLLLAACDVQKPGYLHQERPMHYNTVSSYGKFYSPGHKPDFEPEAIDRRGIAALPDVPGMGNVASLQSTHKHTPSNGPQYHLAA